MNIVELYQAYLDCGRKVFTDTRKAMPGGIFFAIRGDRFNGNRFVGDAVAGGAVLAVADDESLSGHDRVMVTSDTTTALQELALHHRRQLKGTRIIGLTGSNGKTTTKELMRSMLSPSFRVSATEGNLNNHLGVPLTLLAIPDDCQYGIVEMGANHRKEISELCAIAEPDSGLVTNVGKAHLEGFGGFEGVKAGKGELYDWLKGSGGIAFVNASDQTLLEMLGSHNQVVYYGRSDRSLVSGEGRLHNGLLELHWRTGKETFITPTSFTGLYNVPNMLAAACVAVHYGVKPGAVNAALEGYVPENSRSQLEVLGANKLILDCYNANPSSMQAAISNFTESDPGPKYKNRMLVLGDMLELGTDSKTEHQAIANLAAATGSECIFVGEEFSACDLPAGSMAFASAEQAADWLQSKKPGGYFMLVKGSRGIKLENALEALKE